VNDCGCLPISISPGVLDPKMQLDSDLTAMMLAVCRRTLNRFARGDAQTGGVVYGTLPSHD
jgi:hypothetical protein